MKLIIALQEKSRLEEILEESHGEITPELETELNENALEIRANVESIGLYRKQLKHNITYLKDLLKASVALEQKKLLNLDSVLLPQLKITGKIKTPLVSMSVTRRTNKKVVISDFDLVWKTFPDCCYVETDLEKGERRMKIDKRLLLKAGWTKGAGWLPEETVSEYINQRIKGDQ